MLTDAEVREMLLLFLKTAEAAKNQGMWAASGSRKGKKTGFPLEVTPSFCSSDTSVGL